MSQLVYGADPEFFAGYKKDGKYFVLPPVWFREHGKVEYQPDLINFKHPIFLDFMEEYGVKIIEDGVAFEETVIPSTNWKELFERINIGKKLLSDLILSKFPNNCEPETLAIPTINYDIDRWKGENTEFRMCHIFGCDQDYNAWKKNAAGKIVNALKHPFRYGGGHFHVSGSEMIKQEPILTIQCLTLSAGLAAIAFSDVPELDRERTFLYGKPGKYRPQNYGKLFNNIPDTDFGVEYRTPSNRWTNSFQHAEKLFKWIEIGIRNLLEGKLGLELIPEIGKDACNSIINCNQPKAIELLSYIESRI